MGYKEILSEYHCVYDPDHRQLKKLDKPKLYVTKYTSPQLWLFEDNRWLKVVHKPRKKGWKRYRLPEGRQLMLFELVSSA